MKTNFADIGSRSLRTNRRPTEKSAGWRVWTAVAVLALGLSSPQAVRAVIPEPDNVVYGRISIGGVVVTNQQTNVTVEAQSLAGQVLSSYRMGQNANLSGLYAVEIGFWAADAVNPLPPPIGSTVVIVVKTNAVEYCRTNFVVGDRGYVQRIDFGVAPTNVPTGFEAWAAYWGVGAGGDDADGDRLSNYREYLAGTCPIDANSKFVLTVVQRLGGAEISFQALQAAGTGYTNQARYYSLQSATNLQAGAWTELTNVLGANQVFVYPVPLTNAVPVFYRGEVELRP